MPIGTGPAEIAMGPMLIGTVFNVLLYGIMITQVYLYFQNYSSDRLWMKCLVAGLFLADTLNSIFDLVYVYTSLVKNFADVSSLAKADWVFATDPAMTGIIASAVQFFFAWRVKVVTGNWYLTVTVIACAVAGLLASIGTSIAVGIIPTFTEFVKFKVIVIIWLVASTVADAVITCALTFHLQKHKTGFAATDDIVNRIIRLTVQTGLITAVCAIVDLIVYLVDNTGTHLIFNVPLSKLYTNSLMSSLNARGGWKFSQHSRELTTTTNGVIATKSRQTDHVQLNTNTRPEVFVHVESHEMVDVEDKTSPSNLASDTESDQWAHNDRKNGSMV